jgi:hypothetical protein
MLSPFVLPQDVSHLVGDIVLPVGDEQCVLLVLAAPDAVSRHDVPLVRQFRMDDSGVLFH